MGLGLGSGSVGGEWPDQVEARVGRREAHSAGGCYDRRRDVDLGRVRVRARARARHVIRVRR